MHDSLRMSQQFAVLRCLDCERCMRDNDRAERVKAFRSDRNMVYGAKQAEQASECNNCIRKEFDSVPRKQGPHLEPKFLACSPCLIFVGDDWGLNGMRLASPPKCHLVSSWLLLDKDFSSVAIGVYGTVWSRFILKTTLSMDELQRNFSNHFQTSKCSPPLLQRY